ncbi:FKBP-type peptidyl-prolyl cis-trans isomerase [Microbacterium sp.]|uniref:FKBP-type peptidyl-prolyl cis-trans isomerase n=1 Tax=Microbacterium sp. TaxID=51671 RepID=UPI003A8B7717
MRLRSLSALSIVAVSAVLLAGCSDGAPAPVTTADAALCDAQAASGSGSDAVSVEGEVGTSATATFEAPLTVSELEVSTVVEGDGERVSAGDFVNYTLTAYSAETGDEITSTGFAPGELLPVQVSPESVFGQVFGCSPLGSRVVAAFPGSDTAPGEVYVLDVLSVTPMSAWGQSQAPVDGMPTVALADDGTPAVTLPDSEPPSETTVEVLKKGDGYELAAGDYVLLQYQGVRWSNGEVFDQSWAGGTPLTGPTTNYVPGFQKALEGQTVGSQVLAVIPPADGYGEGEINETNLEGDTLVFVIDILAAQSAPTP